jgi:hypothetical protein
MVDGPFMRKCVSDQASNTKGYGLVRKAAEKDAKLFVWYRSIRTPNDPIIPHPRGQWFKTMVPDENWDIIR